MPRMSQSQVRANVGRCVRVHRRALDLSQDALGACLGITQQQVHRIETGQAAISADRLAQIAEALGVRDMNAFFAQPATIRHIPEIRTTSNIFR